MIGVRARIRITGRVQGVWFRGAMQEDARRLGAHGWVRNCPDGAVEAEIEGEQTVVDGVIGWARRGPTLARVEQVEVSWIAPTGERSGFAITR